AVNAYPCICLAIDAAETQPGTLTGRDDIGYPVRLAIVVRADTNTISNRQTYLAWRQQIFRAFRNQRYDVAEIIMTTVGRHDIIQPAAKDDRRPEHLVVSSMIIRAVSREPRG